MNNIENFVIKILKKHKKYVKLIAEDLLKNETINYKRILELIPKRLEEHIKGAFIFLTQLLSILKFLIFFLWISFVLFKILFVNEWGARRLDRKNNSRKIEELFQIYE